ncbi:hypothetical protein ACH5RR_003087 [Cinchona calisaya]|uniref:Uncharacterized protein n=1 Tax=Cinchona calisaya TaxID=153742 RepID=A0ABD3ATV9_9GENT
MVIDLVQGYGNRIWGIEVMGNTSNVRFIGSTLRHQLVSHNWPKVVLQPSKEPVVLYLLDSLPSQNLATNSHIVKDSFTGDMDFESLCLFPDMKVPQNFEIPNFTKYGENGNPCAHVKIFYYELGADGKDERLRICLFSGVYMVMHFSGLYV